MAIAFVQKATATGVSATSVTTPAFASPTTSGNVLIGCCTSSKSASSITFTFSDSKTNTWTTGATANKFVNLNNSCCCAVGAASLTTAGSSHTVSCNAGSGTNGYQLVAAEFSGLTTTLDQTATNTAAGSTTSITATTAATTNANDLVVGVYAGDTNTTSTSVSDPPQVNASTTGVNSLQVVAATTVVATESAYSIISSTGTQAVKWTYTSDSSGVYAAAVAVYKGAAGGGNTYNVSGSDSLGLAESATTQLAAKATGTDSLGLADSATTIATRLASGADSLALSDSAANKATLGASATDTLALSDSAAGGSIFATSASDSLGLSDSAARTSTLPASGSDALGLSDTATNRLSAVAAGSDSLGLSESAASRLTAVTGTTDALALSDTASAPQTGQTVVDALGLADSAAATIQFAASIIDAMGLSDRATATGGQTVAAQISQDAGRPRRTRYVLRVDGEEFAVRSLGEALDLIEKAKALARQSALKQVETAPLRKPQVRLPKISTPTPELKQVVEEARDEIEDILRRIGRDAEISFWMHYASRREDETMLLLM